MGNGLQPRVDEMPFVLKPPGAKQSETRPSVRPRNATEASGFAKLEGSWKSYPVNLTIGGSCAQTTGTYDCDVAEWCGNVNGPDKIRNLLWLVHGTNGRRIDFSHLDSGCRQ